MNDGSGYMGCTRELRLRGKCVLCYKQKFIIDFDWITSALHIIHTLLDENEHCGAKITDSFSKCIPDD